jgi:NAD(P)H-dependent flavin oxidoreductase YrpB (nitropropane dioxygenase family)
MTPIEKQAMKEMNRIICEMTVRRAVLEFVAMKNIPELPKLLATTLAAEEFQTVQKMNKHIRIAVDTLIEAGDFEKLLSLLEMNNQSIQ